SGACANKRTAASRTPPFTITAMNAVAGTLAPSYASGAHAWNGTIAALRKNAASTSIAPATAIASGDPSAATNAAVDSEPPAPKISAAPISNVADATPPSTRYLSAASALWGPRNASTTSAYTGSDMSSSPTNSVRKLSADRMSPMPYSDASSSTGKRPSAKSSRVSMST